MGLKVSDDNVAVFVEEIAFTMVAKAFEPIESFVHVEIQIFVEAYVTDVELTADVLVAIAPGLQIQGHHSAAHNGMFVLQTFLLES
jgi:hypothetical protein